MAECQSKHVAWRDWWDTYQLDKQSCANLIPIIDSLHNEVVYIRVIRVCEFRTDENVSFGLNKFQTASLPPFPSKAVTNL